MKQRSTSGGSRKSGTDHLGWQKACMELWLDDICESICQRRPKKMAKGVGARLADVQAASCRAHRMRAAPRPTNSSTNSEAETAKKGTPASPATARAAHGQVATEGIAGHVTSKQHGGRAGHAAERMHERQHSAQHVHDCEARWVHCRLKNPQGDAR